MSATTPAPTAAEGAHTLSGVPLKLSISLKDLARLDEPATACDDQAIATITSQPPLTGGSSTSPGTESPPETPPSDDDHTPEEARAAVPWQRDSPPPSGTTEGLAGSSGVVTPAEAEAAEDDMDQDDEDGPDSAKTGPKSAVKKQSWTREEDAQLLALVERLGPSNWSRIAAELPSRIGKQCRERWHNHLSPAVKKEGFSPEEDMAIMRAVAEHGTKWAHIVKLIPGRTDNAIKNRWNSTTRKIVRVQRRHGAQIPGLDGCDLATLDAQGVAKHLIAHGVSPTDAAPPKPAPAPSAKRRLTVGTDDDDDGAEPSSKRRASAKRKKAAAQDGLAMLRAATFRQATNTLVAAAAAAESEDGGLSLAEGEGAEAAEGGAAHQGPWPATPTTQSACSSSADDGYTLDALTLLATSSALASEQVTCRSPRMLEAAVALGGDFGGASFFAS